MSFCDVELHGKISGTMVTLAIDFRATSLAILHHAISARESIVKAKLLQFGKCNHGNSSAGMYGRGHALVGLNLSSYGCTWIMGNTGINYLSSL